MDTLTIAAPSFKTVQRSRSPVIDSYGPQSDWMEGFMKTAITLVQSHCDLTQLQ